jgi:hypothetical protein
MALLPDVYIPPGLKKVHPGLEACVKSIQAGLNYLADSQKKNKAGPAGPSIMGSTGGNTVISGVSSQDITSALLLAQELPDANLPPSPQPVVQLSTGTTLITFRATVNGWVNLTGTGVLQTLQISRDGGATYYSINADQHLTPNYPIIPPIPMSKGDLLQYQCGAPGISSGQFFPT